MKPGADLNVVIPFRTSDHWLRLSKEVFDLIGVQAAETRIGLNMSPVLEVYCKARGAGFEVKAIPLFSNALEPALIVAIDAIAPTQEALMMKIEKHFGDRVLFEESDYDWPENAGEILAHYDTPELVLNNDHIIKI